VPTGPPVADVRGRGVPSALPSRGTPRGPLVDFVGRGPPGRGPPVRGSCSLQILLN